MITIACHCEACNDEAIYSAKKKTERYKGCATLAVVTGNVTV